MFQIQVLRLKCKLKVTVNCFTYLIQFLFLFVFFPTVHDLFFNGPRSVYQRSAICFDLRNNIGRQIRSTTYLNSVGMYTSLSLFRITFALSSITFICSSVSFLGKYWLSTMLMYSTTAVNMSPFFNDELILCLSFLSSSTPLCPAPMLWLHILLSQSQR